MTQPVRAKDAIGLGIQQEVIGSFTEIKTAIAHHLRETISEDRFELWFSGDHTFQFDGTTFFVYTLDDFSRSFVKQQFAQAVKNAVLTVTGNHYPVCFEVLSAKKDQATQQQLFSDQELTPLESEGRSSRTRAKQNTATRREAPQLHQRSLLDPPVDAPSPSRDTKKRKSQGARLQDYVFGSTNDLPKTAIRELLNSPGKFSPLALHGPVGCGKSHLLQAIIRQARLNPARPRCLYLTAEQFTSSFLEALNGRGLTSFRSKYRQVDFLAIDDIQFLSGKRATIAEFLNTVETLMREGKQILISSNRPLFDLDFLGEDLITRLSCGLNCPLEYPDLDARQKIVQRLAKQRELTLSPNDARLIAERIGRDVRLLSGAVNRLKALQLVSPTESTSGSQWIEEALSDLFQSQSPIVTMAKIEEIVCESCGVEPNELKSSKRVKRISTARMLAMWLSRKHTSAGLAEIGQYYGGRSHSTVVAAEKKINALLESQSQIEFKRVRCDLQKAVTRLEHELRVG